MRLDPLVVQRGGLGSSMQSTYKKKNESIETDKSIHKSITSVGKNNRW